MKFTTATASLGVGLAALALYGNEVKADVPGLSNSGKYTAAGGWTHVGLVDPNPSNAAEYPISHEGKGQEAASAHVELKAHGRNLKGKEPAKKEPAKKEPAKKKPAKKEPDGKKPDGKKPDGKKPDGKKPDGKKPKDTEEPGDGGSGGTGFDNPDLLNGDYGFGKPSGEGDKTYDASKEYRSGHKRELAVPRDGEFLIMFVGNDGIYASDFCSERYGANYANTKVGVCNEANCNRIRSALAFFDTLPDKGPADALRRSLLPNNAQAVVNYRFRFDQKNKTGSYESFSLCTGCGCTKRTQFYGSEYEELNAGPDIHGGTSNGAWFDSYRAWCLANAQEFGRSAAACDAKPITLKAMGTNIMTTDYTDAYYLCGAKRNYGGQWGQFPVVQGALKYAEPWQATFENPCTEWFGSGGYVTKISVSFCFDTLMMTHKYYHDADLLGEELYDLTPYYPNDKPTKP